MSEPHIYYCKTCKESGEDPYKFCNICPQHKCEIYEIDINIDDYGTILRISHDVNFLEAMIKLKQDNIIEYESRMSQFRSQVAQQKQVQKAAEESSKPHCPHCHSTNIAKIGTGERIGSIAVWGIFSKKINKSFKCRNCGYTW